MKRQILSTWISAGVLATCAAAQTPSAAPPSDVKTAEQVYKNIEQLKGIPADQLMSTMQFMSASLGVQCSTCHVDGKPEADDKGPKKTARQMIAMTAAINKDNFRGSPNVTCYSCHRGSERPVAMPPVQETDAPPAPAPMAAPPAAGATAPKVEDIIGKYVAAVGGTDAIHKVTSRVMKGSVIAMGTDTAIDLYTKAPNKRVSISHSSPTSDSFTAFDGTVGWLGSTGGQARPMASNDTPGAAVDAAFYLVADLQTLYPQVRRGRPTEVNGAMCETVNASKPGQPNVSLYFDQKTGLLVRMVRFTQNPMGRMPVQVDYADYRETDGVKIPWRWTLARPNGRFTIQLKEVKTNVAIDDAKFAMPSGPVK